MKEELIRPMMTLKVANDAHSIRTVDSVIRLTSDSSEQKAPMFFRPLEGEAEIEEDIRSRVYSVPSGSIKLLASISHDDDDYDDDDDDYDYE